MKDIFTQNPTWLISLGDEGASGNRIINNEAGHVQRQLKQIFDYLLIKIYGNATMFNTEQGSYNGNHKRLMKGQT